MYSNVLYNNAYNNIYSNNDNDNGISNFFVAILLQLIFGHETRVRH